MSSITIGDLSLCIGEGVKVLSRRVSNNIGNNCNKMTKENLISPQGISYLKLVGYWISNLDAYQEQSDTED